MFIFLDSEQNDTNRIGLTRNVQIYKNVNTFILKWIAYTNEIPKMSIIHYVNFTIC